MGDTPSKIDWGKAQFKFSVKSPEGKEVKVAIIPWPRPVEPGAAAASDEVKPDASELKNPQWTDAHPETGAQFTHGDSAAMQVEAPGHDGKRVKFIVEQRVNGAWKQLQTVSAVVKKGIAQAQIQAKHPGGGQTQPQVLRFRNVFG